MEKIKEDLKWGRGPTIHIVQLEEYPYGNVETVGKFEKEFPDRILLDIDFVEKLENTLIIQEEEDGFLFFLGTTILHEYVHLGDFNNSDNYRYPLTQEEGRLFEVIVYGQNVHDYYAIELLNESN